jgi:hypothetical protein
MVLVCMHFLLSIDQTRALSVVMKAIDSPLTSQQKELTSYVMFLLDENKKKKKKSNRNMKI